MTLTVWFRPRLNLLQRFGRLLAGSATDRRAGCWLHEGERKGRTRDPPGTEPIQLQHKAPGGGEPANGAPPPVSPSSAGTTWVLTGASRHLSPDPGTRLFLSTRVF